MSKDHWIIMLISILSLLIATTWIAVGATRSWKNEYSKLADRIIELKTERNEHDCDRPESEVPEWFAEELKNTFLHGVIRVKFGISGNEEDVIIMSGKSLDRLQKLVDPDRYWQNYWDYYTTYEPINDEVKE